MQVQIILVLATLACVFAQVSQPPYYKDKYPDTYKFAKSARRLRDVSLDKQEIKVSRTGKVAFNQGVYNKGTLKVEAKARIFGTTVYVRVKLDSTSVGKKANTSFEVTKQSDSEANAS